MATVTATKGVKTAFSGGADELVCVISPAARAGVQIESQGFTLDECTIETLGVSSTDYDEVAFTDVKHVALVGVDPKAVIGAVKISGLTGSGYVTVIPLD